jgi:hypothetical protein
MAQEIEVPNKVNASESMMLLNGVERNGYAINVQGDGKDILKAFEDYLENAQKLEVKSKSNQLIGADLYNTAISEKHFGLFSYVEESGAGNELRFFLNFGTDIYVNEADYPVEATKAKTILVGFVKSFYTSAVNEKVEETNKELSSELKSLSKIEDDIADNQKDKAKTEKKMAKIEAKKAKDQEKIRELQAEIAEYDLEVANHKTEITDFNKQITDLSTKQEAVNGKIKMDQKKLDELKKKLAIISSYN